MFALTVSTLQSMFSKFLVSEYCTNVGTSETAVFHEKVCVDCGFLACDAVYSVL